VRGYTSAVRWCAAGYLLGQPGKTSWEQVDAQDIQRWTAQLLGRYSGAYASIQFRALRQFFKWRVGEEESPDPMARLRAPKVTVTAVPVFTSVELSELNKACQGRSFAARRDHRGVHRDRHPAIRTGRDPLPSGGAALARRRRDALLVILLSLPAIRAVWVAGQCQAGRAAIRAPSGEQVPGPGIVTV